MICPRCESPEGSERLSVPLCERCLDDWWRSGLAVSGVSLDQQAELEQWLEAGPGRRDVPYQPGPERKAPPSPLGLVGLVFRLPRSQLERVKELSRRTRIRQSEYLREAIADLLMKYEESDS